MEYTELTEAMRNIRSANLSVSGRDSALVNSHSVGDGVFLVSTSFNNPGLICGHVSGFTMNAMGQAILVIDADATPYDPRNSFTPYTVNQFRLHPENVVNWTHLTSDGMWAMQKLAYDTRPMHVEE
jgi:hypothetical protein